VCFHGQHLFYLDVSVFVEASASRWAQPICLPALSKPQDLFHKLGPVHFFNASCPLNHRRYVHTTVKASEALPKPCCRRVKLTRSDVAQSWGLSLEGGRPCRVADIAPGGIAQEAGLEEGRFVLAVNKVDVRAKSHRQVVAALKATKHTLILTIVVSTSSCRLLLVSF
jgi:hypothetical protein